MPMPRPQGSTIARHVAMGRFLHGLRIIYACVASARRCDRLIFLASFEFDMDYAACGLIFEKSSLPAMRNKTVRIVSKRVKPRALRLAA
jgi:hypothetical protein